MNKERAEFSVMVFDAAKEVHDALEGDKKAYFFDGMVKAVGLERTLAIFGPSAHVTRLEHALMLCGDAAGGSRQVIEKYCTLSDKGTDMSSGTPLGIRVNTIGNIVRGVLGR